MNHLGQRTGVSQTGTAFQAASSVDWGYNSKGEVVKADSSVNASDRTYQYDGIGNRLKSADSLTLPTGNNYTPNALNQYTAVDSLSPGYDDDGNATAYPLPANLSANSTLTWDAENRLIAATVNSITTAYLYDSQSRRIAQTTGATTTLYVYDGWNPIAEYSATALSKTYTWGMDLSGSMQGAGGVGGLLAVTDTTGSYFPTYDGNGNISEYLDAAGAIAAHYEYDPFGRETVSNGSNPTGFFHRFSTKPRDPNTGLYYYGYRWYDPQTGRWPSKDPINEVGSKLLRGERMKYRVDGELIDDMRLDEEKNLHHFVFNNPANRIDYLGFGHNFGRCCNRSGGNEWALLDGKWRLLKPGECTGIFEDCDGMTCGGGFYYVSAFEWAACVTPGCDSPPFNNRRWEPGGGDGGARPPGGPGGRGSSEGNTPPGYNYSSRPPCACKNPRSGADHNN